MHISIVIQGYADTRLDGYLENDRGERFYAGDERAQGYVKGNGRTSYWTATKRTPDGRWSFSFDDELQWMLEDYKDVAFIRTFRRLEEATASCVSRGVGTRGSVEV